MLPLPNRLKGERNFSQIYKNGRRFYSTFFTVFILEKPSEAILLGFVTAKEVGNAPTRNRIRRQLSEVIRPELANLKPNYSVVIKSLPAAALKSSEEIEQEILPLFKKAGLYL